MTGVNEPDEVVETLDPVLEADTAASGPEGASMLFTAPWCPPGNLAAAALVDDEGSPLVTVVNVDEYPYLADRYMVVSLPTLLVVRDGKERGRLLGAFSTQEAKTLLRRVQAAERVELDDVKKPRGRRS